MKRVYIAGPISGGTLETLANIRRGLKAASRAIKLGHAVFSPHLDFQLNLVAEPGDVLSVAEYQDNSMAWLEVSNEVWVLPGYESSKGTEREILRARELRIPIKYLTEPSAKK